MTASKPETKSEDSGPDGSHAIWSGPVGELRTRRVTANPWAFSEGRSAAPIGPEDPLMRMRAECMLAGSVSTLADWIAVARAPPPAAFDRFAASSPSKAAGEGARATQPAIIQHGDPAPTVRDQCAHGDAVP